MFHTSRSTQSAIVAEVTASRWTHVGVVFERDGQLSVLEAVGPVRWTPWREWRRRGDGLAIRRLRAAPSPEQLARLRHEGERFLGRPYDARFEWDDRQLYCSELIWKMFERALGTRLSEPQRWREVRLSARARRLAIRRLGRLPPMNGLVVTPVALAASRHLVDPER